MDEQTFSTPTLDATAAEALERYVIGGDTACQDAAVAAVVAEHPQLARRLREAMIALRMVPTVDTERSLATARAQLAQTGSVKDMPTSRTPRDGKTTRHQDKTFSRIGPTGGALAAKVVGVALVLGVAYGVVRFGRVETQRWREMHYTTGEDQVAALTLDDGTRVTLAPQTTLRTTHFGSASRTVDVDGEAYFEIARASGAPFVVQSGPSVTRVLGTGFLVRYHRGDQAAHIAVAEGRVNVSATLSSTGGRTLSAGGVADVTDSTVQLRQLDAGSGITESSGEFVFRDVPVPKVLDMLTRWYGYRFQCTDSLVTRQNVNVALSMRSSATALATLEQLLSVSLTMHGDTVTLTPRPMTPLRRTPRVRTYDVWTPKAEVGR